VWNNTGVLSGNGLGDDRLFREAVNAAGLGIYVFDSETGEVTWENDRMFEIFGRRREDGPLPVGEFLAHVVHPGDREAFQQAIQSSREARGPFRARCRVRRPTGEWRWIEIDGAQDFAAGQSASRLVAIVRDVTQQRTVEDILRHAGQQLRDVLNSLYCYVGVLSPAGVLEEANRAPLEAAGVDAAGVLGLPFCETYWWSYSPEVQERLRQAIALARAGTTCRYDEEVRMRDGKLATVDFMLAPLQDAAGRVQKLIASAVDITQRKDTERALRESEALFRTAVESVPHGFILYDGELRFQYINHWAQQILGQRMEDALGKRDEDLWPADVTRQYLPHLIEATESKTSRSFEWTLPEVLGRLTLAVTYVPLVDETARLKQVLAIMYDLTPHKVSAERLSLAQRAGRVGVFDWDLENSRIIVTPELEEIFGVPRGYFQQRYEGWVKQMHPEDTHSLRVFFREWIVSGKDEEEWEYRFYHTSGELRWMEGRGRIIRGDDGKPRRMVGTNLDITERKRTQLARERSEAELRTLTESIPDMVWTANPDGFVDYFNRRWLEITGLSEDELHAHGWEPLVHPDDLAACKTQWAESVATGRDYEMQARLRARDGSWRWFLGRALPLRNSFGEVIKWVGTNSDIHDQKRANEAMQAANQALERSNEDLRQYAYAASHDLQEPLRMIISYSQLMASRYRDQLDEEGRQFLDYTVQGARRIDALLRSLRQYWQVSESGEWQRSPVSLSDVLAEVKVHLETALIETGVVLEEGNLPVVLGERTSLVQLLLNLISNAVKYRHKARPARIHVSAQQRGREWVVSVADNGIGIDAEDLEQIFGLFKRLHTYKQYPGTGIGLALCKRVAERHGGRIWVESQPGEGSTFFVSLPVS
jgi:PAS domain S-box-containing protein